MLNRRIIICLVITTLFYSCKNDLQEVNRFFNEQNEAIEKGKGIQLIYSDSARVLLKLDAPKMIRHTKGRGNNEVFPAGVKVKFYNNQGEVTAHLIADYAMRNPKHKQVVARDNVVLYNHEGDTLKTDELIWDSKNQKIFTDQFVRITTPKELLYGFGFETDPSFTTYKLKRISGRMQLDNLPEGIN